MEIAELLEFAVKNKASDLHLSSGLPPMFRIDGDLRKFEHPVMTHEDVMHMIHSVMNEKQKKGF